jgi:hypothetical protein
MGMRAHRFADLRASAADRIVRLNVPVFAFVAMLATILVGTVPALEASRPHPQGTLRDGRQGDGLGVRGRRLRSALVVSEVALAPLCCAAPA